MLKSLVFILAAIPLLCIVSCGVPKNFQHALYLQDSVTAAEKQVINSPAVIMPGDRLNINITAINKEAAQDFNTTTLSSGSAGASQGYLVDSTGNIELLQLGILKAGGLTTEQLAANLQQRLINYIKGPIVTVFISNFKIDMLGEISHTGPIIVPDGKINIVEAISQAGDLTLYGRRDNILVIRTVNGTREFGRVNINSNHIFESPYYNLKQNDVIYVESDKTRFISNDVITSRNLRNLGIATTVLSTILLLLNLAKK